MNQSAIIVPTYPPHYNFLDFINKLPDKLEFDLVLVLSFKQDYDDLIKYNYKKTVYNVVILEEHFEKSFIQMIIDKKIIITFTPLNI